MCKASGKLLATLPGVGVNKAKAILALRDDLEVTGQRLTVDKLVEANIMSQDAWDRMVEDGIISFNEGSGDSAREEEMVLRVMASVEKIVTKVVAQSMTQTMMGVSQDIQDMRKKFDVIQGQMDRWSTSRSPAPTLPAISATPVGLKESQTVAEIPAATGYSLGLQGQTATSTTTSIVTSTQGQDPSRTFHGSVLNALSSVAPQGVYQSANVGTIPYKPPPSVTRLMGSDPGDTSPPAPSYWSTHGRAQGLYPDPPGYPGHQPPPGYQAGLAPPGIQRLAVRQPPSGIAGFPGDPIVPPVFQGPPDPDHGGGRRMQAREPPAPRMATYDGKHDWRSYMLQFGRMARRYGWRGDDRLDRLTDSLRGKALDFYGSLDVEVRDDYDRLVQKLDNRFGRKDPPASVRRQLSALRQGAEESLEEFAEKAQKLANDCYPEAYDNGTEILQTMAMEAFLRGCLHQSAALQVLNKEPRNLEIALRLMKIHEQNYEMMAAPKKAVKVVSFQEEEEYKVKATSINVQGKETEKSFEEKMTRAVRTGMEEAVKEMIATFRKLMSPRRPQEELPQGRGPGSPSANGMWRNQGTPPRERGFCYRCGSGTHFARECPNRPGSPGPQRTLSPRAGLNSKGLYEKATPQPEKK